MTAIVEGQVTGIKKAAILLVLLGEEASTAVYKNLNERELQRITDQIASLQSVSPTLADQVLREYFALLASHSALAEGGIEVASKLLRKAFGDDTAKMLLEQLEIIRQETDKGFDSLQSADPAQLVKFVQVEHPQTIAMVLAHLGTKAASTMLMLLPEKLRGAAIKRLAEMQQFSPEMVEKISLVLNRKLTALGEQSRKSYGGVKTAAELLNRMDPNVSKSILETVEGEDAKLALNIRNSMFTFEDLIGVPESGIRELLSSVDKKSLALSLKGASEDLKNHIYKTMSSRAVEMLKEDMEALGPVRANAVTAAQQEIVQAARSLEGQGKLVLHNDGQEAYVV